MALFSVGNLQAQKRISLFSGAISAIVVGIVLGILPNIFSGAISAVALGFAATGIGLVVGLVVACVVYGMFRWLSSDKVSVNQPVPPRVFYSNEDVVSHGLAEQSNHIVLQAYTPEALGRNTSFLTLSDKVCIFDYDNTLVGFDYTVSDQSSYELLLFGGDDLVDLLLGLKQTHNVRFCIATRKDQEGALEAIAFLQDRGIDHLFDFLVYERCSDNKRVLLNACQQAYGIAFSACGFIDDDPDNCLTAEDLGMPCVHVQTDRVCFLAFNSSAILEAVNNIKDQILSACSSLHQP